MAKLTLTNKIVSKRHFSKEATNTKSEVKGSLLENLKKNIPAWTGRKVGTSF